MQAVNAEPAGAVSPRVPVRVSLVQWHAAWLAARRGKRPSANQMRFASRWLQHLQQLQTDLGAGTWVPQLEALFEPWFIHDSYANRQGKGSHAAVDRLQVFMRIQQNADGGKGWFLQLDVHNFFNTIHRPTLYGLVKARLAGNARKPQCKISAARALQLQSLCRKLLAQATLHHCRSPLHATQVPPHKRLCNAPPGCGLPIGNLTSQFFANVCLNELDQFVKHTLKVRHYLRYVDDFVLLAWQQRHVQAQGVEERVYRVRAQAPALAQLQHMLASYWGHFAHAHSVRLRHALWARFGWLRALFHINPAGQITPRWVLQGTTLAEQVAWLRQQWPHAVCEVQKGYERLHFAPLQAPDGSRVRAVQTGWLKHGTRRRELTDFYFKEIT